MTGNILRDLSVALGLGGQDLMRIIFTAPKRYKVFEIPKRRGGMRTIAQPSRELKAVQRFLLANVLCKLPVHEAATAYVSGRSIGKNAATHVNSRIVLKLDFVDFFPSITVRDWVRYAKLHEKLLDPKELIIYCKILFWGQRSVQPKCLSIGAPTSPMVSNLIMFGLDTALSEAARTTNVIYTRYADDITVSGARIEDVVRFEKIARSIVRKTSSPRLAFNDAKRGIYTMGQRRMVTGLILTPAGEVSIGRERKRLISVMLHKIAIGQSDGENLAKLKGLLGFCIATEPAFISRMREKYGDVTIDQVLKYQIPRTRRAALRLAAGAQR